MQAFFTEISELFSRFYGSAPVILSEAPVILRKAPVILRKAPVILSEAKDLKASSSPVGSSE